MLAEIERLLKRQTLKIHSAFQRLLAELADYRQPDSSITQDSVMALGFAVINAHLAHGLDSLGRIDRGLFHELNQTGRPANFPGSSLPWITRT
jgi:hypothetical protein